MTLGHAAVLGVVQGLTEFLPVSSSAHLILARSVFGWDAESFGLAFDVACHLGTLAAVILYFWSDLLAMVAVVPRLFSEDSSARRIRLIVVGTLPVVAVGVLFADVIESRLRTPLVCVLTLTVGAVGLLLAERFGAQRAEEETIGYGGAVGLGVAQACALVPGVSRSGATVTIGMLLGVRRAAAARFSFLLGIPAILAAAAKEGLSLARTGLGPEQAALFAVGVLTSAVVGYLTIKYFLQYLVAHRLDLFAYYRLGVAALLLMWLGLS